MTPNRRLKQARELRGWSQAKIAELIGTDATTVSRWERGLFSPTPYFREKLCLIFAKNAEELGLLEADCPSERTQSLHHASVETAPLGPISPLIAPSWPERADTFSYILHSAAHDQQAHILWEDAYVRSLLGQHSEARQLGEASMNAFERVGHLNAAAIREWLSQRESASASPGNPPPAQPANHMRQGKRSSQSLRHAMKNGITLFVLFVSLLAGSGYAWSHYTSLMAQTSAYAAASTSVQSQGRSVPTQNQRTGFPKATTPVPTSPSTNNAGTTHPLIVVSPTAVSPAPTPLPVVTPTPTTRAPSASASSSIMSTSSLRARILPASINPQTCPAEPLENRCTLTLWLSGTDNETFSWSVSSVNTAVQFNPTHGSGTSGQPVQVIAYVQDAPGQDDQLVFSFHSSTGSCTAVSTWHG